MLTDKHIGQWAGYIIEELEDWRDIEKMLANKYPQLEKVFVEMYKKGYYDCKYDYQHSEGVGK